MSDEIKDLFSLEGKTVLLTGASGFLGRAFGDGVLGAGACLLALGRSDRLLSATEEWRQRFGTRRVRRRQVDMYDFPALTGVLQEIAEEEHVDVLVNNAHELSPATGFNVPEGTLEDGSLEHWERNIAGGIYWPALTTRWIGRRMIESGGGSVINVATMYATVAPSPALYEGTSFANPPGYSVAKAGLVALTRYTASFWGRRGIRANAILPGPFSDVGTDGPNAVGPDDPFLDRLASRTALGRVGTPSELVGALLFLASDASSFVTGATLAVDGGWTIT